MNKTATLKGYRVSIFQSHGFSEYIGPFTPQEVASFISEAPANTEYIAVERQYANGERTINFYDMGRGE